MSLSVLGENQLTFEVDNISYGILDDGRTVEVLPHVPVYSGHIVIPENVIYNNTAYKVIRLGENSFYGCDELLSLRLPDSIQTLGDYVFYGCSLKEIELPDCIIELGVSDFGYCYELRKIVLPKKIKIIKGCSFIHCTRLEEIIIPWGCEYVLLSAFAHCSALKSLSYPASILEIHPSSSEDCISLTHLVFGTGMNGEWKPVKGNLEFCGIAKNYGQSPNIREVVSLYLNPPTVNSPKENSVFEEEVFEEATLYVPEEVIEKYRGATMWKNFKNILPLSQHSGIKDLYNPEAAPKIRYVDLNGHQSDLPFDGINIILKSDGSIQKIMK